jgi:uncharacterized protein YndB with AHSA1/START domain
MSYDFTLTTVIPALPRAVYHAWLDSDGHTGMTGGGATMSSIVGADYSAWDGYITGKNLELVPPSRIVQSWRTSEFAETDPDSIITVTLSPSGNGTLLKLEHCNVPDGQTSYEHGGWQENYFTPMTDYFASGAVD